MRESAVGEMVLGSSSPHEGALAPFEEANFQLALWQVLAKQVALYTLGESSSLPEYDAHRLLASACFVLGIDPDDPDPRIVRELASEGVEAAFDRGVRRVEAEATRVSELWQEVCLSVPLLESIALKDTLESLRDFKTRYEPRFFAHEIPADIDYPLCFPVAESVQGADYVAAYLERLQVECRFLQRFDVETCRRLLGAFHPQYGELILNLFEPVATCAIGCALAGGKVRSLHLDADGRTHLRAALEGQSRSELSQTLGVAAARACQELRADDEEARYLAQLASGLVPRVGAALQRGGLEGVFFSL